MKEHTSISPGTQVASSMPASAQNIKELPKHDIYTQSLRGGNSIQCKLSIGAVDDPLEHEADAMADHVMRMPEPNFIQRKCSCREDEEAQCKPLTSFIQKKESGSNNHADQEEDEDVDEDDDMDGKEMPERLTIQKKGTGNEDGEEYIASKDASDQIQSTKGVGDTLPGATKSFMENRFGADFSGVRIHKGEYASKLSDQLNAQAFTTGNDIYFNSGKYAPGTDHGNKLIAHELTHTIQQGSSKINSSPVVQREKAIIGPLFSDRAYTSFHTINNWGTNWGTVASNVPDTMIHELTHVWQYENAGAIYMP